ncbi:MAG: phosphate uptake regulator PhoU [Nanoarchaeota archaeon]
MEYRKLINFGNTSLVVTIPKEWVTLHKLKKGDFIYLEQGPDSITLFPKEKEEVKIEREYTIEVDGAVMETVKRRAITAYINNYDSILFTGKSIIKKSQEIRDILTKNFIAMEIVEESTGRIVARSFVNIKDINLEHNLRRADNMIRTMLQDLITLEQYGKEKRTVIRDSLDVRDKDVNKMVFLSYRFIHFLFTEKKAWNKQEPVQLLENWYLFNNIERLGNDAKRIARLLVEVPKKESIRELSVLLSRVEKMYEGTMHSFYTNNSEMAYKLSLDRTPLLNDCDALIEQNKQNSTIIKACEKIKQFVGNVQNIMRLRY